MILPLKALATFAVISLVTKGFPSRSPPGQNPIRITLFSGSYSDLTNKPALFSGSYADLTGKPTLFSGSYLDLTNKPEVVAVSTLKTIAAASTDFADFQARIAAL